MSARTYIAEKKRFKTLESYYKSVTGSNPVKIHSGELDVLFLRNNPADEIGERNWAQNAAYIFGQIAMQDGVIVLNHPESLSNAINKMYFQHFPEILRPGTIITRNQQDIEAFYKENKEKIILKPLQGSGGSNVFIVHKKNKQNLSQIIEAISRDGYVIAQEFLPEADQGDTRLFLMNGVPLEINGKFAAIKRINKGEDIRSNIHAGGKPKRTKVTDDMLELANILRPKLTQDGMFMVGIDIVGKKLMEINVFSPGGLNMMSSAYEVDFCKKVIESIENKVYYKKIYGGDLENINLACL